MRPWNQVWVKLVHDRSTEDYIHHNYLKDYVNGKRREDGK
jgi:hypothetical protein